MTMLQLVRMANNVKNQAGTTRSLRGRGNRTIISLAEYDVATLRCGSSSPRNSTLFQSPPYRVSTMQSRFSSTSVSQPRCYKMMNTTTMRTTPSLSYTVFTPRTPTAVSFWRRNYVVLPSTFKEFLNLFTIEGLNRYIFGDDKNTIRSKRMRLLPFSKTMGRNNVDTGSSTSDTTSSSSSLSATRSLFQATTATTTTTAIEKKRKSMRDRIRDYYNLSAQASKASTTTGAASSSSSTKSMIMARRANIFLARVKRERSTMIKDFKRSIVGAAEHRRSTMARRRLAYTMTMVRRANVFLEQATDAVSQVQESTRNFMKFQDKKARHKKEQRSTNNHDTQQQNDSSYDDYLLVHPNSKFDSDGFPLTSHILTSGNVIDDEIYDSSTEVDNSRSRRYINPWSISACQHEPFINYLRWKWHQTFYIKDQAPESLQEFMERTAPYISLDNNENIFSNANLDNSTVTKDYSPTTTTTTSGNSSSTNNIENRIKCTWIGHSTCLVQMHGVTILTDPVFSDVIGPITASYRRYVPPSHTIDELRTVIDGGLIDVVCLSHDHYDHLDYTSINDLVKSTTVHVKKWCVPLGMKKWLLDNFGQQANYQGIHETDIIEMEWWDELVFDKTELTSNNNTTKVKVTCAPSQHWCCRTPFDRDIRLWCSWAIETISTPAKCSSSSSNRLAFYFAGDTGVPRNGFPLHKQIGTRLGPFDLAALPIGAYLPRDFIGDSHINPMEARQLHLDLHSTYSLAIHWGTFALGDEPFYEPPCLLRECFDSSTVDGKDPFLVIRQGGYVLSDFSSKIPK